MHCGFFTPAQRHGTLSVFAAALLFPISSAAQLPVAPPFPPDALELTRLFMKLEPPRLASLKPQVKSPDVDLPIALWISAHARVAPEVVISAHGGGLDWPGVFAKFRVPLETVIIPVTAKCPPYGKATGYRRGHGGAAAVHFTDVELAEFVHVRAIASQYGMTITEVVNQRCAGRAMGAIITDAHEKKHGRRKVEHQEQPHGHEQEGDGSGPGNSHGKGKARGKGHDGA